MKNDTIYKYLISNGANIEKDLFDYGIIVFKTYMKYLLAIIPLSFIMNMQIICFEFLLLFIPLRRYIGGYHMHTMKACFFGSLILALAIPTIAIKIGKIPCIIGFFIFITCLCMTIKIGVMDHPNKRVSTTEKKEYRKKAIIIEILYFILSLLLNNTPYYYISNLVILILLFCVLSVLLARKQYL